MVPTVIHRVQKPVSAGQELTESGVEWSRQSHGCVRRKLAQPPNCTSSQNSRATGPERLSSFLSFVLNQGLDLCGIHVYGCKLVCPIFWRYECHFSEAGISLPKNLKDGEFSNILYQLIKALDVQTCICCTESNSPHHGRISGRSIY